MALEETVKDRIRSCTACHLHETCQSPVPFTGRRGATYMVVGEAPGEAEDVKGRPFVGKAGNFMRLLLKEAGFGRWDISWANAVSCRPPKNRTPKKVEVDSCRTNLLLQIKVLKPKVIIAAGGVALSVWRDDWQITKQRGRVFAIGEEQVVVPVLHPAMVLRDRDYREILVADLKQARRRGRLGVYEDWPMDCSVCRADEVVVFDEMGVGYCEDHRSLCGRGIVQWKQLTLVG